MRLADSVTAFGFMKARGPVGCRPLEGSCHSLSIHIKQAWCFVMIYLLQGDLVIFCQDYARGRHYFCPVLLFLLPKNSVICFH